MSAHPEQTVEVHAGDVLLALGATGGITPNHPCWKCGAEQPAHYCAPQIAAERRLLNAVGAERCVVPPMRYLADNEED